MKSLLTVSLLVSFTAGCQTSGSPAGHDRHSADARADDAKESVMRGGKQYTDALVNKDIAALERLWSDELIFINARGQVQNKSQRLAELRAGTTSISSVDLQDQSVRPYGKAAVHTSRGRLQATYSGQESSGDYRITMIWSKHHGEWQIDLIQMTPIRQ